MPSLQSLRRKIASVKNTQKITKAMKMVAAAKLKRAQDRILAARPFFGPREYRVAADFREGHQGPATGPRGCSAFK